MTDPAPFQIDLQITGGMSCAACVRRFEQALVGYENVREVRVDLARRRARLLVTGVPADVQQQISQRLEAAQFTVTFATQGSSPTQHEADQSPWRWLVAATLALGSLLVPHHAAWAHHVGMVLAVAAMIGPGWPVIRRGVRIAMPSMETLIALSTTAALVIGEIHAVTVTIAFTLLGRWIEGRARRMATADVRHVAEALPQTAVLVEGAHERSVAVAQVRIGDLVRLRSGAMVPVDGVIHEGEVAIDRSMLSGESMPQEAVVGTQVESGCLVRDGSALVRATATGESSAAARHARLVDDALAVKPAVQQLVDRIAAVFVPIVVVVALATGLGWWWLGGDGSRAVLYAAAVLVIACPCALGLATPTALAATVGSLARRGIFLATPRALTAAARIRTVALDKTGTLTTGRFRVEQIHAADGVQEAQVLAWAAALETASEHPLAVAIRFEAMRRDLAASAGIHQQPQRFTHRTGGISADLEGAAVLVGSEAFLRAAGVSGLDQRPALSVDGSVVELARAGRWVGSIVLADGLRDEATLAVAALQRRWRVVLLTGDREGAARQVAERLGLDEVVAGADPQRKWTVIEQLRRDGPVAMVGDGLNDAPVLAAADLGIAMAHGSAMARAAADALITDDDLRAVPLLLDRARITRRIIIQNLLLASGYNLVAIPSAAVGLIHPGLAAGAMALSSLLVVGNSLRLR